MKKLLFVLAFAFIGGQAFSQVYIITEKHDGLNGQIATFDSVFVTNPLGVTITHSIPHIFESIIDHNSAFNLILNNVINSGYKIVAMHPFEGFLVPNQGSNFYALRTIYLGIP